MLLTKIQEYNDFPTRLVNSKSSVNFLILNTPIGLLGAESKISEPEIIDQKLYSNSNTKTRCVLNANMLLQYLWAKSE